MLPILNGSSETLVIWDQAGIAVVMEICDNCSDFIAQRLCFIFPQLYFSYCPIIYCIFDCILQEQVSNY